MVQDDVGDVHEPGRAGQGADAEEIRDFCKANMAHFKVPKYVWFVQEFPMTVTGKLQKFRMREIALEKMGKEEVAQR